MQDAYGAIPQLPRESMIERNVSQVRNLSPGIPEGVALGYHLSSERSAAGRAFSRRR